MRPKCKTMTLDPSTDVSQVEKLFLQKISCYYLSNLIRPKYSNLHVIQKGRKSENVENRKALEVN